MVSTALMNAVSIVNLASVRAFAERIGAPVDPLRFRANIYVDGWPPFSELELGDGEVTIGAVRLKVTMRTKRCAATEVNPVTARRDIPVPRLLVRTYGHPDMGVYADVLTDGTVRPGDAVAA